MDLIDYQVVLNKSVYAEFTIYVPKLDMEFAKCREFRVQTETGTKRWCSFASYWKETVDHKGFKPYVKFRSRTTNDKFWEEAMALIDDYLEKHPEANQVPDVSISPTELPF